jgi:PAS domain S-box-containing protein
MLPHVRTDGRALLRITLEENRMELRPAHRLARVNYAPRAAAFALTFIVYVALYAERGFAAWELVFAALPLLVYPHFAYLHASAAPDSKQAELNNLYLDAMLMGVWAAQIHFALWPTAMVLIAIILNSAANGGLWRLCWGGACFAAAAAAWGAVFGYRFDPDTGPAVTVLSIIGVLLYVSWVGNILYVQNKLLVRTHDRLQDSEKQFHFVAETPGETVCVLDRQGRFLYLSSSHAKQFDPGLLGTGSLWLGLVHPADHARASEFLERLLTTQTRQRTRLRLVRSEGPPRPVECHGSPVKNHNGDMTAIVLVTQRLEVASVGSALA